MLASEIKRDWLKVKLTVVEAEAKYMIKLGDKEVPFGYTNGKWKDMLGKMQPGDELWEFTSSAESWQNLC